MSQVGGPGFDSWPKNLFSPLLVVCLFVFLISLTCFSCKTLKMQAFLFFFFFFMCACQKGDHGPRRS